MIAQAGDDTATSADRRPGALRWVPVAAWMAVIFALSALQRPDIPSGFASPGHFGLYFVLGALLAHALTPHMPLGRAAAWAVAIASLYGITDEVHQLFVAGRTATASDWVTDTVGALAGALAYVAARKLLLRVRRRPD